jgi:putative spermidine/putrescine transport system permease protein
MMSGSGEMRSDDRLPLWLKVVCSAVGALLFAPTLIILPLSFTGESGFRFPPRTWSLKYYENFFTDPTWTGSLLASVGIALQVTVVATILGTAAALGMARLSPRFATAMNGAMLAPIVIPSVIVAIGVYAIFLRTGLTGTNLGFVLAHTAMALPFVTIAVSASLSSFDRRLELAAATLGAPPFRILIRVTIPQLLPGILTGAVFAFVTSFDEVMLALYLSSARLVTLPVKMFNSVTTEIDPTIAAASTVILVVTTAVILIPMLLMKGNNDV